MFFLNFFLVNFEYFSQSVGIGEDRLDVGMRKRRKSSLFHLLMSLIFSFGGRMRFGKL